MATKRIYLKDLHRMMDGMGMELAEKVHLLFMANYIDYSHYGFRDEEQVDEYCWCYRDLFALKTKEALEIVNSYVIGFMEEWQQDAPSLYRKAEADICYWINTDWLRFESPMQKGIESAYQAAMKEQEENAIAKALAPFALKTAELVEGKAYEEAAGCCYAIFRCLAKASKGHHEWFGGFLEEDEAYSELAIFVEAMVELYCHLRGLAPKRLAQEMNINLQVLNKETDLFGDMECESRWEDILCDAREQYQDYSDIGQCPMWEMFLKENY